MIITLASSRGAPGVTSWALLLAAAWPADVGADRVVLEADPAGGVLGARYGWGVAPGLVDLLTGLRRASGSRAIALGEAARTVGDGVSVVPAPETAGQCRTIWQSEASSVAPRLAGDARVWFVDAGRLRESDPATAFVERSSLVIIVSGGRPEDLVQLPQFLEVVKRSCDRVGVLVTGSCSYDADELKTFTGAELFWLAKNYADLIEDAAVALSETRARRRSWGWRRALEISSEVAIEVSRPERSGTPRPVDVLR
ncbi:hypothetical protein [Ilumatobacter nonamiensis]|uniref:hypothetical protein n=1 Tax=Ilumatobacter nonamiensis TaxID=467093 RepID=UPI00034A33ED|nr:hypothetical protein [Ilumatobacter nonamiensis]